MPIDDHDYMQHRSPPPPGSNHPVRILAIAVAVLILGSAAIWFMRDAGGPAEGSLRVNINTATLTELENIPGIGDSLSLLIVAGRPYQSVGELVKVRGIAEKKLDSLRPYVKVEGETEKLR